MRFYLSGPRMFGIRPGVSIDTREFKRRPAPTKEAYVAVVENGRLVLTARYTGPDYGPPDALARPLTAIGHKRPAVRLWLVAAALWGGFALQVWLSR